MIQDVAERIVRLGHDSFRIDGRHTVYFDPYKITAGPPADLVLISHEHFDHCSPEDVAQIQHAGTVIVTESDCARKLEGDIRIARPGDRLTIYDMEIEAVTAYNTDKPFHPRENGWLGFIIDIEGVRVYHAGDTDLIPEMQYVTADIALLPVSGTYVMSAQEAARAALTIQPRLAIPMHYGAIVGDDQDALDFKQALEGRIDVLIL